jgi:hypothetical protein
MTVKNEDWKNKRNYDYLSGSDNQQFAWELLRRKPEYKEAWDNKIKEFREGKNEEQKYFQGMCLSSDRFDIYDETKDNFLICWDDNPFGVACGLYNPEVKCPSHIIFSDAKFGCGVICGLYKGKPTTYEIVVDVTEAIVKIDLTRPIAPQKDSILQQLQELQNNTKLIQKRRYSPSPELYISYLRCLDASASGAKRKDAAQSIFAERTSSKDTPERMYSEALKQAKNLQNNYTKLIKSSFREIP